MPKHYTRHPDKKMVASTSGEEGRAKAGTHRMSVNSKRSALQAKHLGANHGLCCGI